MSGKNKDKEAVMTIADIAIINATILPMGGAGKIDNGCLTITGNGLDYIGISGSGKVEGRTAPH